MPPHIRTTIVSTDPFRIASDNGAIRTIVLFLIFTLLLTAAGLYVAHQRLIQWSETSRPVIAPQEVELPRGGGLLRLSRSLEETGLVSHHRLFQIWVRLHSSFERFQAGRYKFEGQVSPREVAEKMIAGDTYTPVVFQVTVPEGATLKQIAERMAAGGVGTVKELLTIAQDPAVLARLNVPASTIEGFLYPATYPFASVPTPEEAFGVMVQRFWKVLPSDYESRVKALGLSLPQAVAFASLVELETARDEERAMISEVIWNRLRRGLPLGIDAAIIYGIDDYKGDITWKHLRDDKNPYNTRLRAGLPPTPIANPSIKSLLAVLEPSNFGYLYYVVDADSLSAHRFTKTLQEHNKNVREYVARLRRTSRPSGTPTPGNLRESSRP